MYIKSLQHTLKEAHEFVRVKCQVEHSRQKMLECTGKCISSRGYMVLLHSYVIPRGKSRKLHNLYGKARFG